MANQTMVEGQMVRTPLYHFKLIKRLGKGGFGEAWCGQLARYREQAYNET